MSNLIKYPFVNLQGKETKVIQYETDEGKFVPFDQKKKVVVKSLDEVEKEKELQIMEEKEDVKDSEFSAGVPVTNFDEMFKQKSEEADKEAASILENAREEAREIVQEAREQADAVRENARQEGTVLGKEEGLREAQEEIEQIKEDLFERKRQQEQEYEKMIQETEGQYVDILCSLIRKLTGVIVSDRKEVILHLIRSGIADIEPAKHYTIRVCAEDLLYIESNKEDILEKTGITGTLEVQEEKGLTEGECIIETDKQMIDCGFQTQLGNLISTLRMLV
ncbi:MAG: hypothetical protein MR304_06045 [Eubacterium sp.]|nr:hypothetical protein [Eubacterium sp.]